MLNINAYLELEKQREIEGESSEEENSLKIQDLQNFFSNPSNADKNIVDESIHIHYKAIFDAFNEALNHSRLYSGNTAPLPWDIAQPMKLTNSKC